MNIALICPSNILYMPYLENYTKILDENDVAYDVINWNRFKLKEDIKYSYTDTKIGHQRTFLDYFKFSRYVLKMLNSNNYDKVIIFGLQLVFFLKSYLKKKYAHNFIVDIRDYNLIVKFINFKKIIQISALTILSSPGFEEWLPKSNKYVINHNTSQNYIIELEELYEIDSCKYAYEVSYIGSLRDYELNIEFIKSLKNVDRIILNYHGEGTINKDINTFLRKNEINNVNITGRYLKSEERSIYLKSDFVNALIPNTSINNNTLLPNRLYKASMYGKPVIVFEGTYLSKLVKKYDLGLVIDNFTNIESELYKYMKNFNKIDFEKSRIRFWNHIIEENLNFESNLKWFINKN